MTEQGKLAAGKEKLQQKVIDFERLEEAGLKEGKWDVVFITCVLDLVSRDWSMVIYIYLTFPASGRPASKQAAQKRLRRSSASPSC